MNYDVYRKLAQKLYAIPIGFPETEIGIELKLPAKIYTIDSLLSLSENERAVSGPRRR